MIDIGVARPSARASDDQHRDRRNQAIGKARLWSPDAPSHEGKNGDSDHHRHEPARDLIGHALYRRPRALCLSDHLDDAGEHGIAPTFVAAITMRQSG
jgi:hypothetical protein